MRLIDADALKKRAIRVSTVKERCYMKAVGTHEIDKAPTIEVPTWIPVTERLPEVWQDVIICDVREDYVTKGFLDDDKMWHENEYVAYDFEEFTHWMPLPDAPKDGEEHG
jgi:hypothetical protein